MRITTARLSIVAVVSAPLAASLHVAPDSPCSKFCGNELSSTAVDELACDAGTLTKTTTGLVWEKCIQCLLTSNHVSGDQTDLQWLLYNLRFNMGYCLFGGQTNPCVTRTACEPFKDAVRYKNLTTAVGPYDYCRNWEQDFIPKCSPCLIPLEDGIYQNNYMMILEAACEQRPAPGTTLSISGDPFGSEPVEIVPPQPSYSSIPETDYGPVSLGARVGIAFGGLAAILAIVGFCIVCNGKRRRRAYLRQLEQHQNNPNGWQHPKHRYGGGGSGPDMTEDTPVSQRPLRGWGTESPLSAQTTDGAFPTRYYSPYTSTYNSPVSAGGPSSATWPTMPISQEQLDHMMMQQPLSPGYGASPPPPAFSQWPTVNQEQFMMQMHAHHERRQNELAVGLAMSGGNDAVNNGNMNMNMNGYPIENKGKERDEAAGMMNLNGNGYPIESKGKEPDEAYEMVESPYGNGNGNENYDGYAYRMPAEPQAPVLHHPGYGRHHGSRPGSGGTGAGLGLGLGGQGGGQGQRGFSG